MPCAICANPNEEGLFTVAIGPYAGRRLCKTAELCYGAWERAA